MKKRVINAVQHWFIMQIIFAQSPAGRKRTKHLISLGLALLSIVFVLLTAHLFVSGPQVTKNYMEQLQAASPAR